MITPKSQKVQKIKKQAPPRPGLQADTFAHPQKLSKRTKAVRFDATAASDQVTTKPLKDPAANQRALLAAPPDLPALGKQKITFVKLLKGDDLKISCTVDIGGRAYVVKGGVGNGYIADHVTHSGLFQKLNVPGLAAPGVVKLTPDFVDAVDSELERASQGNPKVNMLRKALKDNQQIAVAVPGLTVEEILQDQAIPNRVADKVRGMGDVEAIVSLLGDLTVSALYKDAAATIADRRVNPQNLTVADVEKMQVQLVSPANQAILSMAMSVLQRGGIANAVKDHDARQANLDLARRALIERVKTREGAAALGAMCAVDLLCGMQDRILGDFNGGNFMFDADRKDFWCVDNAKSERGLTGLVDVGHAYDANREWKTWILKNRILEADDMTANVADRMHALLFRTARKDGDFFHTIKFAGTEEADVKQGVASGVKTAIDRLRAVAADDTNDLTPAVRMNLKDRLAFVDQKEAFTSACTFDSQFSDIPTATKANFKDKSARALEKRSKLEKDAAALKEDARKGTLSIEQLLAREAKLLEAQHLANLTDANRDRRLDKALFESKLARLLLDLDARKNELLKLPPPLVASADVQKADFANKLKPWEDELKQLGDAKGVLRLQNARVLLEKAMDGLVV